MKYNRIILIIVALVAVYFSAASESTQAKADALRQTLKKGMSTTDSINILYDVYDLTDQEKKEEVGLLILNVAERGKNYEVLYDMIPQMSTLYLSDETPVQQDKLLELSHKLPEGNERKAVECYVQVNRVVAEGAFLTPDERNARLLEYLKEDVTPKDDIYQNFLDLYRVVVFLGQSHAGGMYMEYLERLEKMIDQVPEAGYAFPSRFYTTAANYYTRNGYAEKAVAADKKLLEMIGELEKYYVNQGRKYRNFDRFKYISYRRMLANYQALTRDEVEKYYKLCLELADKNPEINKDFYQYKMTPGYYYFATGRYAEAVPALQEALKHVKAVHTRYTILGKLKAAADSCGNQSALLYALTDYSKMLEDKLKSNAQESMMELKTRYEVRKLEEARRLAESEKHEAELASNEKLISLALIAVFVLAVILMFLYRSHFSLIHKSKDLKEENQKLHSRIEELLYDGKIPGTDNLRKKNDTSKQTPAS